MDAPIEGWMVLPDRPDARRVVAGWPLLSRWMVTHASGNPWLVAGLDQDEVTLAAVGATRVAVIGSCSITATQLADLVTRVRSVAELDAVARALPGCWHLAASIDGAVRVQGSLTGVRRVFHTRIREVPVAGDRADVLATMAGSGIDEQALAVRVACGPKAPPPLSEHSLWRGVRALAPDHYLRIDPSGTVGELRWWQPPEPELPLTTGARAVRQALDTALAQRGPIGGRLSADLSGGMDSTSLCFLIAHAGIPDLLTFRWAEADAANDDAMFAAHAASGLSQAEHLVVSQADLPAIFAGAGTAADTEAPYRFTRTLARTRHTAALLTAHGAQTHLAGHGGDELFHGPVAYLHPLLRQRPRTAIRHTRGYRALHRWPWAATVSELTRRDDLRAWWHQQAQQLTSGPLPRYTPMLGWGRPLRAPAWITPAAADTTRAVLRFAGDKARPLGTDRGQHVTLAILRMMGPAYRQLSRVFALAGLRLELPYFDDRVVEAVLAVRPHERRTPWRYKPLLVEAMRGVLPETIASRTTKGEFGADLRVGWRRHLTGLLEVFADSALATHGLINPDVLRRQLLTPQADNSAVFAVEDLLGCETWLRATQTAPPPRRDDATAAAR